MMRKIIFWSCLMMGFSQIIWAQGASSSYGNVLKIGEGRGRIVLLSYGIYNTAKNSRKLISFRVEMENTSPRGEGLSKSSLEIGAKKEHYFELRNRERVYTPDAYRVQYPSLGAGQKFIFTLRFTVDAGDPLSNFELRYAPKTGPQLHTPWLPLKTFFAQAPQDTRTMSRHGYFSLIGYHLGEPDKKKKRKLTLNLIVGNDRNYASYFTTGLIPETTLIYGGDTYYFELMTGVGKSIPPINPVPPKTNERPDARSTTTGKSTERELVVTDVRELTLTFMLPEGADLKQLQLRYKDPFDYVDPSDWLPLAPYMSHIPPIQSKLKMAPRKTQEKSASK